MQKYMPKLLSHTAPSGKEHVYSFLRLIKRGDFYITSYTQQWCTGITEKTFSPKPQLFLTARAAA